VSEEGKGLSGMRPTPNGVRTATDLQRVAAPPKNGLARTVPSW